MCRAFWSASIFIERMMSAVYSLSRISLKRSLTTTVVIDEVIAIAMATRKLTILSCCLLIDSSCAGARAFLFPGTGFPDRSLPVFFNSTFACGPVGILHTACRTLQDILYEVGQVPLRLRGQGRQAFVVGDILALSHDVQSPGQFQCNVIVVLG